MKFHQLNAGDIFVFNERKHIKLNNVMAQDVETKKQVFMKRSDTVLVGDAPAVKSDSQHSTPKNILDEALMSFQDACLKQLSSHQDEVSPSVIEAEINRIRKEILQHYGQLL